MRRILVAILLFCGLASGEEVLIDDAWIAAHGGMPIVLTQPDSTYRLMTDIRASRTAFVLGAPRVILDLGGHTVTYGDTEPIVVPNGTFETGAEGWNLTGAPTAAVAPNTHYLGGKQVLRIPSFTTTQRILSPPIAIPEAGRNYVATVVCYGNSGMSSRLTVWNATTGQLLTPTPAAADQSRGFSPVIHFVPTTNDPVYLQIEAVPSEGNTAAKSIEIDDASVTAGVDPGVIACKSSGASLGLLGVWANLSKLARDNFSKAGDFTIRNGKIIQGRSNGYGSSPIFASFLAGSLMVDGVETYATGTDTMSIQANGVSGPVTIRNCTISHNITHISNRMRAFAAILATGGKGEMRIDSNVILDCPQIGIHCGGTVSPAKTFVTNNTIRQRTVVTNGYAIHGVGFRDFEVAYNRVMGYGRGIGLDGYGGDPSENGHYHHNVVNLQEKPEPEYGDTLDARALRVRSPWNDSDHHNIKFTDNIFVVSTGPGLMKSATAMKLNWANATGSMNNAGLVFERNVAKAVAYGDPVKYRAAAVGFELLEKGINPVFRNNTLESNDTCIDLSTGGGSSDGATTDLWLVSNTLVKSAEGSPHPFIPVQVGWYKRPVSNVFFIDSRGEPLKFAWAGSAPKTVGVGNFLNVHVENGVEAPVTVADKNGKQIFAGTASNSGDILNLPVVTTIYNVPGADIRKLTTESFAPFKITTPNGEGVADPSTNSVDLRISPPPPSPRSPRLAFGHFQAGGQGRSLHLHTSLAMTDEHVKLMLGRWQHGPTRWESGVIVGVRQGRYHVMRQGMFRTHHVIGKPSAGQPAYVTRGGDFQTQETADRVGVFLEERDDDGFVVIKIP